MKKAVVTLLLCVAWTLTAGAQHTVENIRKQYQGVHEWIAEMSDNFPSEGIPSEYFDLHITKNLPASGPHDERIRLYHGELESGEEGNPEKYESEVFRCDQQAQRMILLFKGIDQNSYLPL